MHEVSVLSLSTRSWAGREKQIQDTLAHTYIHTYIQAVYLFVFLIDCCRLCKSMLIVCMAVSLIVWVHGSLPGCWERPSSGGGDPPGPCRGQGGQDRGTMIQLRQPIAGTAYDLTYYILSFISANVQYCTYIYIMMITVCVLRKCLYYQYIQLCISLYMSMCMYICMYI